MITISDDFKTKLEAGLIMPRIYITKNVRSGADVDYDKLISASVSYGIGDSNGLELGGSYNSGLKAEVVAETDAIKNFLAHYETAAAANWYNAELHARYITYMSSDLTHYPIIGGGHRLYRNDVRTKLAQVEGRGVQAMLSADKVIDPSSMASSSDWSFPMDIQKCIKSIVKYGYGDRIASTSQMQITGNLPVDPLTNNDSLTYREALRYVLAVSGGYLNDDFAFRRIYLQSNANNTHSYDQSPMSERIISVKTAVTALKGKGVRMTANDGKTAESIASGASSDSDYFFYNKDKNPFFNTSAQLLPFVRSVTTYTAVGKMAQTNAELEIAFDPRIEPGDWIRYRDEYGDLRYSYITQITYTANGVMKLSSRLADYEEA